MRAISKQQGKFGKVDVAFNNSHNTKQRSGDRERIAANIIMGEQTREIFHKTLETHRLIKEYICKIKNENPNMGLDDLKMLTSGYIEKRRFKNFLFSSIELELYYIDKIVNSGKVATIGEGVFLSFLETSLTNKRFELGKMRKAITFHDLDVTVMLDKEIPEFDAKGSFYVNVGSHDLETLSDLHMTIFYTAA